MNKEEWLDSLNNKLCLPDEYSKEIVAEFESHLYQSQYDSKFELKQLGNINLLINQIMKSKKISTLDLLKLRSTWSLVSLIIALLVIPYVVLFTLYNTIVSWVYSIFFRYTSDVMGNLWLGGFWLCIVVLLVVLSFSLTRILQKWKYEKQRLLSLSIAFFLILLFSINSIYFWEFSEKSLIYAFVSISTLFVMASVYYKTSIFFVSKFKHILGNALTYVLVILLAFLIFLPVILFNDKMVSAVATIWYYDTIHSAENIAREIDVQLGDGGFDLNTYTSTDLQKFGKISEMTVSECWDVDNDPNTQGCNYDKESRVLDSMSCSKDEELPSCKEFIIWEDSLILRSYRVQIYDIFECYTDTNQDDFKFQCFFRVY
jgi:hypothetical protein